MPLRSSRPVGSQPLCTRRRTISRSSDCEAKTRCKTGAVFHCHGPEDVQAAVRVARDCDLPLSVRGGGHDWAGRALCDGLVIDLSGMNAVAIEADNRLARIAGGARAANVAAAADG